MTTAQLTQFVTKGRKILGAGTNYYALLKILNAEKPAAPVIFMKPTSAYIEEGQLIKIPKGFSVNEEIELGVIIGKNGKHIKESEAMEYVGGYCAALDLTATCRLKEARSKGLPWEIGKGFDTACPVSKFLTKEEIPDPHNVQLWCSVNGQLRQNESTNNLIFSIPTLISYISQYITLESGDLILTGSPPGMGPILPNDVIECGIKNVVTMKFSVTNE